jgi:hypothetical protein
MLHDDLFSLKVIRGGMRWILECAEQHPEAVATFVKAIGKEEEFRAILKDIRSLLADKQKRKTVIH